MFEPADRGLARARLLVRRGLEVLRLLELVDVHGVVLLRAVLDDPVGAGVLRARVPVQDVGQRRDRDINLFGRWRLSLIAHVLPHSRQLLRG